MGFHVSLEECTACGLFAFRKNGKHSMRSKSKGHGPAMPTQLNNNPLPETNMETKKGFYKDYSLYGFPC